MDPFLRQFLERRRRSSFTCGVDDEHRNTFCCSRCLDLLGVTIEVRISRIHQHGEYTSAWQNLAHNFQPLRSQFIGEKVTPVTLAPEPLILRTKPPSTGSLPVTNTIGIVEVASRA